MRPGFPPPVETLQRQIAAADALLFATPEYNYSMSRVLKNAIDWVSHPPINKPEVLIGQAHAKFAADGRFTDEAARGFIRDMLVALESWTRQIGGKR